MPTYPTLQMTREQYEQQPEAYRAKIKNQLYLVTFHKDEDRNVLLRVQITDTEEVSK